ncbi:hypothetical protein I79_020644 [Cricetulus griseus]|uniref:Uncharacterized protein n=1 Tax=Cricetulus griseus TaxID=10029 RepID=G3IAL9_CRIGR|nr:hypothetical protein I79_020644 [Cricetulus griseus]
MLRLSRAEAAGSQVTIPLSGNRNSEQQGGLFAPPTHAVPVPIAWSSTLTREEVPC